MLPYAHALSDDDLTDEVDSTDNDGSDDDVPRTRKAKTREQCLYGAKCYRKNPDHRRQFAHPGDADYGTDDKSAPSTSTTATTQAAAPVKKAAPEPDQAADNATEPAKQTSSDELPPAKKPPAVLVDIFTGKLAWISKTHPKFREISRYMIAYDGDVTQSTSQPGITHIVVGSLDVATWAADVSLAVSQIPGAHVVTGEWVLACAAAKKLVDESPYSLSD